MSSALILADMGHPLSAGEVNLADAGTKTG
jgi:hypothetical protein